MLRLRKRRGATARVKRTPEARKLALRLRLRWLGGLLALVGVGGALYGAGQKLMDPAMFPLRHVHLEGELRNLEKTELQQLVEGFLGQNFFLLDIASLHKTLMANPWIEAVAVRRVWPDGVAVEFRERTAFGYWGRDEMVDVNGERFRPSRVIEPGPWPHVVGPDGHEQNLIRIYRKAKEMVGDVGLGVVRLVQDERRAWSMVLDNGIVVSLGREHFMQRLQRFVDIYPRLLSGRATEIAAVDLRYINGFAVRWKAEGIGSAT